MRNLIGLFCIIGHSALWASDIPEDVRSFSLGEEGPTIFWHQNQIHLFEDALDENQTKIQNITKSSTLEKKGDFYVFKHGEVLAYIIPGQSMTEVVHITEAEHGKLNENIYGQTVIEAYPPGKSNLLRIKTKTALTETINGKRFKYDASWLLRKYYLACSCHPSTFANEVPPWMEGTEDFGSTETIDIEFKEPTDGMTILNGFVDADRPHLFSRNNRLKEIEIISSLFKTGFVFSDEVRFTGIPFPKKTKKVSIRILSVYPGSKSNDTAISAIFGWLPKKANNEYYIKQLKLHKIK
ncbi:MAG: hypothetical protein U1F27_03305 [Turneriella sp.]